MLLVNRIHFHLLDPGILSDPDCRHYQVHFVSHRHGPYTSECHESSPLTFDDRSILGSMFAINCWAGISEHLHEPVDIIQTFRSKQVDLLEIKCKKREVNYGTCFSKWLVTTSLRPVYNRSPCLCKTIVYALRYSSSNERPELFFFWISWMALRNKFQIDSTYFSSIFIWNAQKRKKSTLHFRHVVGKRHTIPLIASK